MNQNQLEFAFGQPHSAPAPPFVVTRPLRRHRSCNRILERVRYVRRFFGELDGETLKVGLTRAASGMAIPGGSEIWLHPGRASYHTIAHEFIHLLQCRDLGVPQGEKSCDVYSLARHWTLNDVVPSYVRIPTGLVETDGTLRPESARIVYDVAAEALMRRGAGLRTYIAFFENRLRALASSPTLERRTPQP